MAPTLWRIHTHRPPVNGVFRGEGALCLAIFLKHSLWSHHTCNPNNECLWTFWDDPSSGECFFRLVSNCRFYFFFFFLVFRFDFSRKKINENFTVCSSKTLMRISSNRPSSVIHCIIVLWWFGVVINLNIEFQRKEFEAKTEHSPRIIRWNALLRVRVSHFKMDPFVPISFDSDSTKFLRNCLVHLFYFVRSHLGNQHETIWQITSGSSSKCMSVSGSVKREKSVTDLTIK